MLILIKKVKIAEYFLKICYVLSTEETTIKPSRSWI